MTTSRPQDPAGPDARPRDAGADTVFWAEVEAAFSASVDLDEPRRRAELDARCADRPDVRSEVESLLAAHTRSQHFMQHPTMAGDSAETACLVGDVVGQFKLVELIASGGMATVFRAERADGAFSQQVAVKIISSPVTEEDVKRRFLAERQILASLHHPHIVSLLDGGLTPQGHAYLIMEFVDGVPVTAYCRARRLPVDARLRLFRQVCDAVQYAHARLVVHRDLKPANVLVTSDGVPKVLDFGIATLLESPLAEEQRSAPALAASAPEPLTPNYASPEQLRGERVTAASDVYALGMLLFELIAGARPYEVGGRPRAEATRIVDETPTLRPSDAQPRADARPPYDLRRTLRGDLDAITLRACHREADRRYASADALSEDIGRHLRGAPVEARKATLGYVVGKLAARHRVAFVSAVLSSALVVAALGVAVWQAHAARVERERAVRRFDDVRALANVVIFKIHDAIAPLPGSTPVRQTIVTEGLKYLERLTADAAGDTGLQLELGRAYLKIGEVQGRPNAANLGDRDGALVSFGKARALLAPLALAPNAPAAVFGSYLDSMRFTSETLAAIGGSRRDEATAEAREAVKAAERFAATHPAQDQATSFIGAAEFALAGRLEKQESMAHWQKAGAAYEALLARKPDDPTRQRNVALVEKYVGGILEHERDYDGALPHHQRALDLDQQRVDRAPDNRLAQFDLAIDLSNVAYIDWREQRLPEAIARYARSLDIRERLLASDPRNQLSQEKVAFLHRQLGSLYLQKGDAALALDHYQRAAAQYDAIQNKDAEAQVYAGASWFGIGQLVRRGGEPRAACEAFRRAFDLYAGVAERERRDRNEHDFDPLAGVARAAAECGYGPAITWARSEGRR